MTNNVSIHKYKRKYHVTVYCTGCETYREEVWTLRPDMKIPHVPCVSCRPLFKGDADAPDVRNVSMRYNNHKKKANL